MQVKNTHYIDRNGKSFQRVFILGASSVKYKLLSSDERRSSGSLHNAILPCIIAANKLRIDLCLWKKKKKKMYQAETISLVINWSSSGHGDITAKCQDYLFIYLFIFLLGGSSAVRSISVQSLLFSEVIKKSIDLSVSDSYLLPSPLVLCFVLPSGPPGERKVCFADAERLALLLLHSAHRQWHGDLGAQPNLRIDISTWKSSCYWLGATLLCAKYPSCIFLNQINDKTGSRLPSALG